MTTPKRMLAPADSELARLMDAVRPEYRVPLLVAPRGNKLFNKGPCEVPGCSQTVWSRRSVCGAHAIRWLHARQAGSSWEEWIATTSPHTTPQPCIVEGCEYGRQGQGLCARHIRLWRKDSHGLSREQWAALTDPVAIDNPPQTCAIPRCAVWRHGNLPFCSSDQSRWDGFRKRQPEATVEDFIGYVERMNVPVIDVSVLPPGSAARIGDI